MGPTVFLNKKRVLTGSKKRLRHVKSVGLGFKTPREAIDGSYIDKKCPFTGNVSIRGRILTGTVVKMKMQRTIVIRRDYLHFVKKYNRYEEAQKHVCPLVTRFQRRYYWGPCNRWRMPSHLQDCP